MTVQSPSHLNKVPRFYTVQHAAAELTVSPHTLRAWITQRRIAHVKLGRAVRIPATEIERLIQQGTVPSTSTHER